MVQGNVGQVEDEKNVVKDGQKNRGTWRGARRDKIQ